MFIRCLAIAMIVGVAARADDPKPAEKPKVKMDFDKIPDDWKLSKSKDKSHGFLIPKQLESEEFSEGTFKVEGFTGKRQVFAGTLKDGRVFVVAHVYLGGPATKDLKINDVYDLFYDADKSEPGTKISEPKPIALEIGGLKGKEYFITDKEGVKRVMTLVVRGRVVQLIVAADSRAKVTDNDADRFLTSLVLYKPAASPPPVEKKDK
jgi:hypothetical protein